MQTIRQLPSKEPGSERLPLVGVGGSAVLRTKTKTSFEGKPRQSGGASRLPLVGLGARKPNQERRP